MIFLLSAMFLLQMRLIPRQQTGERAARFSSFRRQSVKPAFRAMSRYFPRPLRQRQRLRLAFAFPASHLPETERRSHTTPCSLPRQPQAEPPTRERCRTSQSRALSLHSYYADSARESREPAYRPAEMAS